ncbi:hypothetical protein NC653_039589 [Populus alba x Populus x berolinensis]|uniref:Uncharacterized protein n=1 Tax=Populus alba x Populus x berolinensis TaxID=444605 RepID=A0AAD6LBJ0_9ROSI|nr:hypothetical protein NC653_039589 [Populus alba x Populus x berolinensis]
MAERRRNPRVQAREAAVIFNRKREASAEGRRPGRRWSCGLIWVEALLLRGEKDAAEKGGFGWICCWFVAIGKTGGA